MAKEQVRHIFAIPVEQAEMGEIAAIADKVVDLLAGADLAPTRKTMIALLTIVANNREELEGDAVGPDALPGDVQKAIGYTPEPVGDLDEFLRNPPRRGATRVGKDGNPMFMAPPSKVVN